MVLVLTPLNPAADDCLDDLEGLDGDAGFARILQQTGLRMPGLLRRALERRWRRARRWAILSHPAAWRCRMAFHDPEEEIARLKAVRCSRIPLPGRGGGDPAG